jgi:hypothetical protein
MKTLTVFAISAWLGMLAFFAFAVAPAAFGILERPAAARLVSTVMPRYHWAALALGLAGALGMLARPSSAGGGWLDRVPLLLVLVMLAVTAVSLFVFLPEMEGLRDAALAARAAGRADAPEVLRFGRLHVLSSAAGTAVMAAGVAVLVLEALRGRSAP